MGAASMERSPRVAVDWFPARTGMDGFVDYATRITRGVAPLVGSLDVFAPARDRWSTDEIADIAPVHRIPVGYGETRTDRTTLWYDSELPAALAAVSTDGETPVVFAPAFFLPRGIGAPSAVTVHDLSFERLPDAFSEENRALYIDRGRPDAERADAVLAVSRSAADDVQVLWGIDPARIVVTPLGPSVDLTRTPVPGVAARSLGVAGEYLLCVSPGHHRKNLERVVREYLTLPRSLRLAVPLVLANADHWSIRERLAAEGADETVRVTARLDDATLDGLYAGAVAVLHGSSLEGFGFPALNAMALGTPVIANDAPAINDVARGAGFFVDIFEPGAMAGAIEQVVTDAALRETLAAAGLVRARDFDWATTAHRTATTLADVSAGRLPTLSLAAEATAKVAR